ncbi:MAG: branched-chain amino acid transaminase [Thermoanaerobaculia bacterium]|nr:MAG: branched-chain amino acid transaminase [Thermoanaerobaculia bacterium]
MNGRLVDFEQATVHVMAHALHYGSGLFEGIRSYRTPAGPAVFRLPEHLKRLENSCKVYRMEIPFSRAQLTQAVFEIIRANDLEECYLRPIVYRGFGTVGLNPLKSPVEVVIAAFPWGRYLGDEAMEKGVDACVSTWRRSGLGGSPALAKATANYLNSQLIKMEAVTNGYAEGIALDTHGYVSEGSGENIFLVQDGVLYTPPVSSAILPGITRNAVITLAEEAGIPVRRESIPRGMLYTCDEAFFSGTAVEIVPIRSVDRIAVGEGGPGPMTRKLTAEFLAITRGEVPDRFGWLSPVPAAVTQTAG